MFSTLSSFVHTSGTLPLLARYPPCHLLTILGLRKGQSGFNEALQTNSDIRFTGHVEMKMGYLDMLNRDGITDMTSRSIPEEEKFCSKIKD